MRDTETGCARCGRVFPAETLRVWEERARFRVFNGPSTAPAAPGRAVYSYIYRRYAHLVCSRCETKLKRGAGFNDVHNRKIALWTSLIFAAAVIAFLLTPVVMPAFLAAFWWW